MEKSMACGDVVPGCKTVLHGKDEAEVMMRATEHAKSAHNMPTVSPEVAAKVKAAIKDKH